MPMRRLEAVMSMTNLLSHDRNHKQKKHQVFLPNVLLLNTGRVCTVQFIVHIIRTIPPFDHTKSSDILNNIHSQSQLARQTKVIPKMACAFLNFLYFRCKLLHFLQGRVIQRGRRMTFELIGCASISCSS